MTPSVKQDKLAIFNVEQAMKLKTDAVFAAIKQYAGPDDIHWVLSLLNDNNNPAGTDGELLSRLPKCGWHVKRQPKLNEKKLSIFFFFFLMFLSIFKNIRKLYNDGFNVFFFFFVFCVFCVNVHTSFLP